MNIYKVKTMYFTCKINIFSLLLYNIKTCNVVYETYIVRMYDVHCTYHNNILHVMNTSCTRVTHYMNLTYVCN